MPSYRYIVRVTYVNQSVSVSENLMAGFKSKTTNSVFYWKTTKVRTFRERKVKVETDAETGTSAVEKMTQSGLPPSRRGKRRVELWVSPDAKKQVKRIAVDEEKSQERVMAEALNMLFKSRGVPPIA